MVPNPESALNEEAGRLLLEEYDEYARYAKLMTGVHAANATGYTAAGGGGKAAPRFVKIYIEKTALSNISSFLYYSQALSTAATNLNIPAVQKPGITEKATGSETPTEATASTERLGTHVAPVHNENDVLGVGGDVKPPVWAPAGEKKIEKAKNDKKRMLRRL